LSESIKAENLVECCNLSCVYVGDFFREKTSATVTGLFSLGVVSINVNHRRLIKNGLIYSV
jgi:hypothetical protein